MTPIVPKQSAPPFDPISNQDQSQFDPSKLLFNKVWWLFFNALANSASSDSSVTEDGVKVPNASESTSDFKGGLLNVKMFGAKGDGIKDDAASIQKALDAAAIFGNYVSIPGGTYLLKSGLVMREGVKIIGESMLSAALIAGADSMTMITLTAVSHSGVEGLRLDANGHSGVTAIRSQTYPNINNVYRNVRMVSVDIGFHNTDSYFITLDNVRIQGFTSYGFLLQVNSNSIWMTNCSVINTVNTTPFAAWGLYFNNGGPISVNACTFEGFSPVHFHQANGISLTANYFENTGGSVDHWLELGLDGLADPLGWVNGAWGVSVVGNNFGVGADYACELFTSNGVVFEGNNITTGIGAWRFYTSDISHHQNIRFGQNAYFMNGGITGTYDPTKVITFDGDTPATADSLNTNFVQELFAPQVMNPTYAPRSTHLPVTDSSAIYVDRITGNTIFIRKTSGGSTEARTIVGPIISRYYFDADPVNDWMDYVGPSAFSDGVAVSGYAGVQIQSGRIGGTMAQFGGYDGSAYFATLALGPKNTVPSSTRATVHIKDKRVGLSTILMVEAGDTQGTDHLQEWRDNGGTVLSYIAHDGTFSGSTGAIAPVVVSTQFDKTTDTTLANIPGLSFSLLATTTYTFEADIQMTLSVVGGLRLGIGGTATLTSIIFDYQIYGSAVLQVAGRNAAAGLFATLAGPTAVYAKVRGSVVINGAGTFTLQFAQVASNGTSSVLVGSSFTVAKV